MTTLIKYHNDGTPDKIAEVGKGSVQIGTEEDILDIIGDAVANDCNRIIIHSESFNSDFFNLGSGVAGEIFQKFSNYRMRLAIVGDFSALKSKSWKDFIRESNRGSIISFVSSIEEAISRLKYR